MQYEKVVAARFLQRPNRFIARCLLEGRQVTAHVKNTGRCRELLVPGAVVYLEDHRGKGGKARKTDFSLIAVEKMQNGLLINMDSQAPNAVAAEGLLDGTIRLPLEAGEEIQALRREVAFGGSRFDLEITTNRRLWYVEVKGVTLEETTSFGRTARFPDAPTQRGVKHVHELMEAKEAGHGAVLLFLIQMEGADEFQPNWATHREFGEALRQAEQAGVTLLAYNCSVKPSGFTAENPVKIHLNEENEENTEEILE